MQRPSARPLVLALLLPTLAACGAPHTRAGPFGAPPTRARMCPLALDALRASLDGAPTAVETHAFAAPRAQPIRSHLVGPGEPTGCLVSWGEPRRWGVALPDEDGRVRFNHLGSPLGPGETHVRLVRMDDDRRPEVWLTYHHVDDEGGEALTLMLFDLGDGGHAMQRRRLDFDGASLAWALTFEDRGRDGSPCRMPRGPDCTARLTVTVDEQDPQVWHGPWLRPVVSDAGDDGADRGTMRGTGD